MDSEQFDRLSRSLGQGTTRRGTLGVLAGLAGLGLGEVAAKRRHRGKQGKQGKQRARAAKPAKCTATKTSNSACAQFCAETFGANTPAASQCTSNATKCQGPCSQCGPACKAPCKQTLVDGVCCTTAGNTATGAVLCCDGLTKCADGVCRANCCDGLSCGVCQKCQGGACVEDASKSSMCCGDEYVGRCERGVCVGASRTLQAGRGVSAEACWIDG